MKRNFIFIGAFLLVTGLHHARGQSIAPSILNATGGTATIAGNTYDWSVGEMSMASTFIAPGITVTQGILQPTNTVTGVQNTELATHLRVFPNPAYDIVNLQYTAATQGTLSYTLMDVAGRAIMKHSAEIGQSTTTEQLNMAGLATATYMLEVSFKTEGGPEQNATYKIAKLK